MKKIIYCATSFIFGGISVFSIMHFTQKNGPTVMMQDFYDLGVDHQRTDIDLIKKFHSYFSGLQIQTSSILLAPDKIFEPGADNAKVVAYFAMLKNVDAAFVTESKFYYENFK
jgi:hypothetical protein